MKVSELMQVLALLSPDNLVFVGDTEKTTAYEIAEVTLMYDGGSNLFGVKICKRGDRK